METSEDKIMVPLIGAAAVATTKIGSGTTESTTNAESEQTSGTIPDFSQSTIDATEQQSSA